MTKLNIKKVTSDALTAARAAYTAVTDAAAAYGVAYTAVTDAADADADAAYAVVDAAVDAVIDAAADVVAAYAKSNDARNILKKENGINETEIKKLVTKLRERAVSSGLTAYRIALMSEITTDTAKRLLDKRPWNVGADVLDTIEKALNKFESNSK